MSRPPLSSTWEALGTTAFYRREEVYSMCWSITGLSNYRVAASRFGGPVALLVNPSKPVISASSRLPAKAITVYSSAGILLHTVSLDSSSKIVAFGFDLAENLAVVYQDGFYRLHPLTTTSNSTGTYTQHSLGPEAQETGVLDARIHDTGFVFLAGSLAFFEVHWGQHISLPDQDTSPSASPSSHTQINKLAEPSFQEAPSVWSVIPPEESNSRSTEVLVSVKSTLLLVDPLDAQDQVCLFRVHYHYEP